MKAVKNRDYYLDFLRGIAAINIIIIHTCFWSGESYVPTFIKSLSLLIDVPFFFFLAGWSRSFNPSFFRTIRSLINLWVKYVFFITIYFAFLLVIGEKVGGLNNYLSYISFVNAEPTKFFVIMGSIWFMPVYYSVVPFCMLIISFIHKNEIKLQERYLKYFLLICVVLFLWSQSGRTYYLFTREILFYSVFFLAGFILKDIKIETVRQLALYLGFDLGIAYIIALGCNVEFTNLQSLKFPPHIVYMMLSFLSIIIALFCKGRINISEKNQIVWVGRNAIWFYFCQGISSTLIYNLVEVLQYEWYLKLTICIVVNILLTVGIVFFMRNLYVCVEKLYFNFFNKRKEHSCKTK